MNARVLLVDDEAGLREMLRLLFSRAGYRVSVADGETAAVKLLGEEEPFDVVVTDLAMPDGSGMGVLRQARQRDDSAQVIVITAYATTADAVRAMREGAYDYVQKPFKNDELLAVVEKAIEKRAIVEQNRALRRHIQSGFRDGDIVGKSRAITNVLTLVQRVATAPASVLITGESGTGKELIARALHNRGERASKPFVAINCGAMPEALLESELFGHEKGAFTGAVGKRQGLFRAANGGTLFLDEIGELPLPLQVKLLRVLQQRTVRPVGSEEELPVDVRVVAATNRRIEQEVQAGRFREDLFYRLNVIHLHLPPLRERTEDIPLLAEHFLTKHAATQDKRLSFAPDALRHLLALPLRGNVRELENLVERAVTLSIGPRIELADLTLQPTTAEVAPRMRIPELPETGFDLDGYLAEVERQILLSALAQASGVRTDAAKLLRMSFRSFRYRLAKYGLSELADAEDDVVEDSA
ncbi:MAG TPA: sigma-54 dependent transcriptional regulator [Polyangiales bacterium]|nr:sigma-54 dependent transcriptional regulator [Polyangiales bacterium]